MLHSSHNRSQGLPAGTEPKVGGSDPGAQHDPDDPARLLGTMESAVAGLQERVARLEGDVRTLQSQNANRS